MIEWPSMYSAWRAVEILQMELNDDNLVAYKDSEGHIVVKTKGNTYYRTIDNLMLLPVDLYLYHSKIIWC